VDTPQQSFNTSGWLVGWLVFNGTHRLCHSHAMIDSDIIYGQGTQ